LPDKPALEHETLEVKWHKWRKCRKRHRSACGKKSKRCGPMFFIVIGDDQHENLIDDNMPPFTIFMGKEAEASVSLRLSQSVHARRTGRDMRSTPSSAKLWSTV
jgi:hypothetical protein